MIYHSIRLTLKPGVSEEARKAAFDQWHQIPKEVPAVQFYCIGRDIGGEFEYGAMFAFKDVAGYREFIMAPATWKTDELGLPLTKNVVSMDITDDPDPDIAEKIAAIHRERFESDPATLDLVRNMESYSGSGVPEA